LESIKRYLLIKQGFNNEKEKFNKELIALQSGTIRVNKHRSLPRGSLRQLVGNTIRSHGTRNLVNRRKAFIAMINKQIENTIQESIRLKQ
jgi:hypothetical protein